MSLWSRVKKPVLFIALPVFFVVALFLRKGTTPAILSPVAPLPPPEISGWIPWWDEAQGYATTDTFGDRLSEVSPVWFMIGPDLTLTSVGTTDQTTVVPKLKASGIQILPTLGSELTGTKLTLFFQDEEKQRQTIASLGAELTALSADGLDIDLEGIAAGDRDAFSQFIRDISQEMHERGLLLSVSVHAQTPVLEWEGVLGQDLRAIGNAADEVRIMAYDKHSAASGPGAIAPVGWVTDVVRYTTRFIPQEKIVVGIPSYGYVWTNDGNAKGLQYDEMQTYLNGKTYNTSRDQESGELVITGDGFTAWLSDATAMKYEIERLRSAGMNRFIVWHLAGLDEAFFDTLPKE